ncbi:MAG: hypothetical protein RIC55_20095 [Pirellulaceae bacterium]
MTNSERRSQFADTQVRRNARTRDAWELYAVHRGRVTQLLSPTTTNNAAGRLCVLGAGNGNDLDLPQLTDWYDEVRLVDLDEAALQFAIERQPTPVQAKIVVNGGVDVTGVLGSLDPLRDPSGHPSGDAPFDASVGALGRRVELDLPGPFEAVASIGLLTQLIESAVDLVGREHPRLIEAIAALRAAHLRLLADLLAPGGRGVLVTELVSSDTFPGLADVAEAALPRVVGELLAGKNFFSGVNPAVIKSLLESDPLSELVRDVEVTLPWRWQFVDRTYAVYAVAFTRR